MRTSETVSALVKALVDARTRFAPVLKDTKGQVGQNREYMYADLAQILDAVMPGLLAAGLVVVQTIDAETSSLLTRLVHVSGEWVESAYPLKLDVPPQQLGSALTYGRRYSISSLLCLAAEDDDGATAEKSSRTRKPAQEAPQTRQEPSGATHAAPAASVPLTTSELPPEPVISEPQAKRLFAIARQAGWKTDALKAWLLSAHGLLSTKDIPKARYNVIVTAIEKGPESVPAGMPTADEVFTA